MQPFLITNSSPCEELEGEHPRLGEVGHDAHGDSEEACVVFQDLGCSLLALRAELEVTGKLQRLFFPELLT